MFQADELGLKSGLHRTYAVYTPADKEPYMTMEIELVIKSRLIFSIPVWRFNR